MILEGWKYSLHRFLAQPQKTKKMKRKICLSCVTFTILLGLTFCGMEYAQVLQAKAAKGWSVPANLSNSEVDSYEPSIAADPSGAVHVIWVEKDETNGSSYILLTSLVNGIWSSPNEIIAMDNEQIQQPSLVVDSQGKLHMVWRGDSNYYYSQANAFEASSARSWSTPMALEFPQNFLGPVHLIIDAQDYLHMAYTIQTGGNNGIYYLSSKDLGVTWEEPVQVKRISRSDEIAGAVRIAAGDDGSLYMIWTRLNYPETFPPTGIFFTSSNDQGITWSPPLLLAEGPYDQGGIVVRQEKEVHVVYSGTQPDRFKFHLYSLDGGKNWSPIYRNLELGGFQGHSSLVVDSEKQLHWLTVASVFKTNTDTLIALHWLVDQWSPYETILPAVTTLMNPGNPAATIALGNELHLIEQQPLLSSQSARGYQNDIFYARLDLPVKPISLKELVAKTTDQPSSLGVVKNGDTQNEERVNVPGFSTVNEINQAVPDPVLLGAGTAIFLLLAIMAINFSRLRRR